MRLAADGVFREERARLRLLHTCERCAMFDPSSGRCAHGYPNEEHREAAVAAGTVVFCKEWELG